ncbi:hypothetical protein I540_2600 [Mycobacteroides abscessus subsp. bolletii 1513]|uniref:Uncharacterized protein n=1 Tax=Mycobacteroides abscessus subsp. bolletii 1513 TaxID=1299321 RepID=X8DVH2_9MYCO|nr:hypothetical protein I540_2600 [Mycobacteroides abscessus subsp. bolletii 1513]
MQGYQYAVVIQDVYVVVHCVRSQWIWQYSQPSWQYSESRCCL